MVSRRCLERPFGEYAPSGVRPINRNLFRGFPLETLFPEPRILECRIVERKRESRGFARQGGLQKGGFGGCSLDSKNQDEGKETGLSGSNATPGVSRYSCRATLV